jgi:predicted AAA+ superfamily ATPase
MWKQLFPFSKDLLYRYYSHFLDSTLIHETRTFSPSVHARQRNPAKVYPVDTGLGVASHRRTWGTCSRMRCSSS